MLLLPQGHNEGPADPVLLGWIKAQLDALLHLEPLVLVVVVGALLVAIPIVLVAGFAVYRWRGNTR